MKVSGVEVGAMVSFSLFWRLGIRGDVHICNALHGWSTEQKNEQQNNAPNPTKQCSCRLSGSSENRAFEGAGLLGHSVEIR